MLLINQLQYIKKKKKERKIPVGSEPALNWCVNISIPIYVRIIKMFHIFQTAEEQERGLPVTLPMYDKPICNVAKTQADFIDYMVMGLYEDWHCESLSNFKNTL